MSKQEYFRLTFQEQMGFTDEERLILYYREHPVEAQKELIGYNLNWFQRKMLKEAWVHPYNLWVMGRGCSKTFIIAIISVLWAILYPGWNIGIIAPVFRQANYVFDEIDKIYNRSPYIQRCAEKAASRGPLQSIIRFNNGSFIEGLPIGSGEKVRGRRYRFILIDEAAQHSPDILNRVIIPFMSVKIGGFDNKLLWASSAFYKHNFYYPKYIRYRLKQLEEPKFYSVLEFNYIDILADKLNEDYQADIRSIQESQDTMTNEEFAMEYLAKFPDESMGFFSSSLLESCIKRENPFEIELKGCENDRYVMSVDCGRKHDNFVVTMFKLKKEVRYVVRIIAFQGITYQEMVEVIRRTHADFGNIVAIGMDQGGGGLALKDYLAVPWVDSRDGREYPPILDIDDEGHKQLSGLSILRLIKLGTRPQKAKMFDTTKADMEHGKIKFPIDIRNDPDPIIREAAREFLALKTEMGVVEVIPTAEGRKFVVPSRYSDDRLDSFVIGVCVTHDIVSGERHESMMSMPIGLRV